MLPSEFKAIKALAEALRAELVALRQVGADQVSAIRDAEEAAKKNRGDIPRAIATLQPTEAANREDRTYRQKNYAMQVILAIATCGAFIAAAIYAGFAYRALKEAQKQTTNTERFFRTDERSWVEFDPLKPIVWVSPVPIFGTIFKYEFIPRNVGKTLARDIVVRIADGTNGSWDFGQSEGAIREEQDVYLMGGLKDQTGKPILIGSDPIPKVLAPGDPSPVPLMLHGPAPIHSGKVINYGYLIGRIDYVDAFDVPHWKKFCFVIYDSAGDVENCKYGNDEDRNPEYPAESK